MPHALVHPHLPTHRNLPHIARDFVATVLRALRLDRTLVDDAVLCASELVTNACVHAKGGDGTVLWLAVEEGRLRVVVYDGDENPPVIRELTTETRERGGGRGLYLVDALTEGRWGTARTSRTAARRTRWARRCGSTCPRTCPGISRWTCPYGEGRCCDRRAAHARQAAGTRIGGRRPGSRAADGRRRRMPHGRPTALDRPPSGRVPGGGPQDRRQSVRSHARTGWRRWAPRPHLLEHPPLGSGRWVAPPGPCRSPSRTTAFIGIFVGRPAA